MGLDEATPSSTGRSCWHLIQRDRKSTRLNSSHTVISTLSLHDALPILPEILVHDFRKKGYLPEALLNFLALLGWSPGGDRERMSMEEMMSLFSVDGIGRSNAKFDRAKLLAFNTEAGAGASPERLIKGFRDYLGSNPESPLNGRDNATLTKNLEMKKGIRTLREVDEASRFLFLQ